MRARALHSSPIPRGSATNRRGLAGCEAMGFSPWPVQRQIWRLLEAQRRGAPVYPAAVVEVPRRAGKTDAIMALLVGRCKETPDYLASYAAQTGLKSRARFLGLLRALNRGGLGGFTPYRARGEEAINFHNGSLLAFYPPQSSSFRGDPWDTVCLDEAQEVDPEDAADLLGGVMPSFDTRPEAQLIVSGTAGPSKDGLLWEALEKGRARTWGILEYAAPEGFDADDPAGWLSIHPGPAGVSSERAQAVLLTRHAQLEPEVFAREYLGIWPEVAANAAFPVSLWNSLAVDVPPARPQRYGLAFDCNPEGTRAAVVACWRVGRIVWGGVLEDREGIDWVAGYVAALALRDRLPVTHDSTPWNGAVAAEIARDHPKVKTKATTSVEFARACAMLASEVQGATFRHSRQPALDDAVAIASKRPITDGGWGWGRRASGGSIAPLVAMSVALLAFDSLPAQRLTKVLTAQVR